MGAVLHSRRSHRVHRHLRARVFRWTPCIATTVAERENFRSWGSPSRQCARTKASEETSPCSRGKNASASLMHQPDYGRSALAATNSGDRELPSFRLELLTFFSTADSFPGRNRPLNIMTLYS